MLSIEDQHLGADNFMLPASGAAPRAAAVGGGHRSRTRIYKSLISMHLHKQHDAKEKISLGVWLHKKALLTGAAGSLHCFTMRADKLQLPHLKYLKYLKI